MTSPSALSEVGGFLLFLAFVALLFVGWVAVLYRHAPVIEAEPSRLDLLDRPTEGKPACHSTGPRGGHYVKAWGPWWVCQSCGETWQRAVDVEADDELAVADLALWEIENEWDAADGRGGAS